MPMKPGAYLAVRAAPNVKSKELDRISPGHMVIICTGITERQWVGILYYGRGGEDVSVYAPQDCGLIETAEDKRTAYQGPCQSGWVARRYLWLSAG